MARYHLDRARGHQRRVDSAPVVEHVRALATQWSRDQIAAAANCTGPFITRLVNGEFSTIRADYAARLITTQLTPTTVPETDFVDATGTLRRLRALTAIGHGVHTIARELGIGPKVLGRVINRGQARVKAGFARSVTALYTRWSEHPGPSVRARTHAAAKGWPPPIAWDADTISDPAAHPEWTGYCGTDHGWWTHRLQNIPTCPRCDQAHTQWKTAHAHLDAAQSRAALLSARAAASRRETVLAEDGRELMRLGVDCEQAAARLGITRGYLQEILTRHPETYGEAA